MARPLSFVLAVALLTLTTHVPTAHAQTSAATWSQDNTVRIVNDVQKKLNGLTNYGVFDWITFGIRGKTLILKGYASRPILKKDAENAVKSISGIDSVENQIEVLPLSPNDDRIRTAVYTRIYTAPSLRKYTANSGRVGGPSVARMAGGITNDPPIGYHAIHIIVKNGNVALYGVVNNSGDVSIAGMQANSAPGAFSVENNLDVPGALSNGK